MRERNIVLCDNQNMSQLLRQDQVCSCKKKILTRRDRVCGYEERKSERPKKRKFAKEKGNASF
jgi:hypothetical protein